MPKKNAFQAMSKHRLNRNKMTLPHRSKDQFKTKTAFFLIENCWNVSQQEGDKTSRFTIMFIIIISLIILAAVIRHEKETLRVIIRKTESKLYSWMRLLYTFLKINLLFSSKPIVAVIRRFNN